jgi:ABC-type molybdenum transport system ATPase subunit/photorepair protein PhrA
MGLSAGEAVGTGYEGVFSRRRMTEEQRTRIQSLLEPFVDLLDRKRTPSSVNATSNTTPTKSTLDLIYDTDFSHFPANQQALLLFLRAIVSRPSLLILDEASQGMDEETWARCRVLLDKEWAEIAQQAASATGDEQAVVVVSHWEEEVPWDAGSGRVLRLHEGKVVHQE